MSGRRVFRYRLDLAEAPTLDLPAGAEVVSVAPPRDLSSSLDLWAVVDPDRATVKRHFRIAGTGHPLPDDAARFLGTVPMSQGSVIFHVFEAGGAR